MVLSNIDLEHTIKNGFRKCGLYPLNPEAFAIEHEINTEIKATEFENLGTHVPSTGKIDVLNKIWKLLIICYLNVQS